MSEIAALGSGSSLIESVSVGANPTYVVGADGTRRVYAISQGTVPGGAGQVAAIEAGTFSVSSTIPVGVNPVYGVMTVDTIGRSSSIRDPARSRSSTPIAMRLIPPSLRSQFRTSSTAG